MDINITVPYDEIIRMLKWYSYNKVVCNDYEKECQPDELEDNVDYQIHRKRYEEDEEWLKVLGIDIHSKLVEDIYAKQYLLYNE